MSDTAVQNVILIIDDTPTNLGFLVEFLTQAGFEVSVATSGETALKQLQHQRPDLILLDVMMPGIDGFETCRRLKAAETTRDIPVIFMTALSDTADKVQGFAAGGVDYVTKPLQQEEVLARVQTHLELRRLQRLLQEQNELLLTEAQARQQAQLALQEANEGFGAAGSGAHRRIASGPRRGGGAAEKVAGRKCVFARRDPQRAQLHRNHQL